jgi:hypothetical protein
VIIMPSTWATPSLATFISASPSTVIFDHTRSRKMSVQRSFSIASASMPSTRVFTEE